MRACVRTYIHYVHTNIHVQKIITCHLYINLIQLCPVKNCMCTIQRNFHYVDENNLRNILDFILRQILNYTYSFINQFDSDQISSAFRSWNTTKSRLFTKNKTRRP